ncbi:MAG: hypothetical protein L6Q53_15135 [Candidatus Brocadia sinica]|nr:hypothetical protein [Candidatus Brocadia sinica]
MPTAAVGKMMRNRKLFRNTTPRLLIQRNTFEAVSTRLGVTSSHKAITAKIPKKKPRRMTTSWFMTNSRMFMFLIEQSKDRYKDVSYYS